MMGHKERAFAPLERVSLEDLVPADHFYRHLERSLDLSFVRDLVAPYYAAGGRPSIDPVVFFKLQLILFFEGVRSERQLMRVVADRLSARWYAGYDLGEALPDHSSLTKIRQRYGLETFRCFFDAIVAQCQEAGLIRGEDLYIDATKVLANASLDALTPRFAVAARAHVDDLFALDQTDGDPTGRPGAPQEPDADAEVAPPVPLRPAGGEDADLVQANATRHDWIAAGGRRDRTRLSPRFHRTADYLVNTTDPDATYLHLRDGVRVGYQAHYVVDGGPARIILSALVAPAEVDEDAPALDLLWHARFRWQLRPRQATADKGYATVAIIRSLEDQGLRAYLPLPLWNAKARFFAKETFSYDAARDAYTCPGGETLSFVRLIKPQRLQIYRAPATTCAGCALRDQCTESRFGRSVARSYDEDYVDRVRAYQETEAYKKALRKRSMWVEPLFGEAKEWHGLRRFRLRRLWRVNAETLLTAAGQNLKRLLSRAGWGRRPFPSGAAGVVTGARARVPALVP
jgi:transposase